MACFKNWERQVKPVTKLYTDNPFRQWHGNGPRQFASNRLKEDVFYPHFKSSFVIEESDSIFAIGSCFARALEPVFRKHGHEVLSETNQFDKWIPDNEIRTLHVTNKYNPKSIFQDLELAIENHEPKNKHDFFIDVNDDKFLDPLSCPIFKPSSLDEICERRKITNQVNALASKASILVITLGLIEVWEDKYSGMTLNFSPSPRLLSKFKDRFEFKVLTYEEVYIYVEKTIQLLNKCNPGSKKIITVSPIPLFATFSNEDIVVANTHSKSTLRSVAGEFCKSNKDILYFPSYEMVVNNQDAWMDDLRHVKGDFAHKIIDYLIRETRISD